MNLECIQFRKGENAFLYLFDSGDEALLIDGLMYQALKTAVFAEAMKVSVDDECVIVEHPDDCLDYIDALILTYKIVRNYLDEYESRERAFDNENFCKVVKAANGIMDYGNWRLREDFKTDDDVKGLLSDKYWFTQESESLLKVVDREISRLVDAFGIIKDLIICARDWNHLSINP